MKKRILLCLILALVWMGGITSRAASDPPDVVRVGFFNFSGYHEQDEEGRRSGYGYEFMQRIGNYMDCTYEYVGYDLSYSENMELLEKGELDVVTSVSRTPEREAKFLFSEKSIGTNSTMFTVKAGNMEVIAGNYDTYDGLTVGMLDGNSKNANFERLAAEKGFSFTPVYYETEGELTEALQAGKVDGIVTGSLRATSNEWLIESFDASDFYVTVRKDLPELMAQINDAIDQLDLDDPDWRTALHRKYYNVDSGGLIMLTAEERAYLEGTIISAPPLRVLVDPDRRPYSYFEGGKARGILPLLFQQTADQLELPYEILEPKDQKEYLELRRNGDADIVLDFASDYYMAEEEGYKITDPYMDTSFTRLVRRDYRGECKTVAATDASDALHSYIREHYDEENILYYDSVEKCVQAVIDGEADSTVLYTYAAESVMQRDYRNRLSFTIMGDSSFSYGVSTNAEACHILRSILNKAANALDDETKNAVIMQETEEDRLDRKEDLISFCYPPPNAFLMH